MQRLLITLVLGGGVLLAWAVPEQSRAADPKKSSAKRTASSNSRQRPATRSRSRSSQPRSSAAQSRSRSASSRSRSSQARSAVAQARSRASQARSRATQSRSRSASSRLPRSSASQGRSRTAQNSSRSSRVQSRPAQQRTRTQQQSSRARSSRTLSQRSRSQLQPPRVQLRPGGSQQSPQISQRPNATPRRSSAQRQQQQRRQNPAASQLNRNRRNTPNARLNHRPSAQHRPHNSRTHSGARHYARNRYGSIGHPSLSISPYGIGIGIGGRSGGHYHGGHRGGHYHGGGVNFFFDLGSGGYYSPYLGYPSSEIYSQGDFVESYEPEPVAPVQLVDEDSEEEILDLEGQLLTSRFLDSGDSLFLERRYSDAAVSYQKAIDSASDLVAAHFRYGQSLLANGQYDLAAKSFKEGISTNPDGQWTGLVLDQIYGANKSEKAEHLSALSQAALNQPQNGDLLYLVGIFLYHDGQQERSQIFFRKAAELAGNEKSHILPFLENDKPVNSEPIIENS